MPRKKQPYTYFSRKDLGITYVYANEDVWDEKAHKYVRKRHMIGKLDPETNEIIPNAGRGGYHGRKHTKSADDRSLNETSVTVSSSDEESGSVNKTQAAVEEKTRNRYEEEKAAFEEYQKAIDVKFRELKLKIDQLTVINEELQRRNNELSSKVTEYCSDLLAIAKDKQ